MRISGLALARLVCVVFVTVLVIGVLSGCAAPAGTAGAGGVAAPSGDSDEAAAAPEEAAAVEEAAIDSPDPPQPKSDFIETYAMEQQIIVSGPPEEVNRAITNFDVIDAEPVLVGSIDLSFLLESLSECDANHFVLGEDLVVNLYQLGSGSAQRVVSIINGLDDVEGVLAEPNYLVGRPRTQGHPWTVGGSPWTVGGSPLTTTLTVAAAQTFADQWALTKMNTEAGASISTAASGANVPVAVFDTFPTGQQGMAPKIDLYADVLSYTLDRNARIALESPVTEPCTETFGVPCIPILAESGVPYRDSVTLGHETLPAMPGEPNLADHGYAVASLVRAVAPDSNILVYRVLDDFAQGDLYTLNVALASFLEQFVSDASQDQGAVINLSLGVRRPPDLEQQNLPDEIRSLDLLTTAAYCNRVVVAAATGNDVAADPDIPAAWDTTVLSVGASNRDDNQSCFSNNLSANGVLAPGGDGNEVCQPMLDQCEDDCDYAVISTRTSGDTGYGYWAGTSFAAPLVSGLAARIIEERPGSTAEVVFQELQTILP